MYVSLVVTSTGFPNVALSMIQERGNEYNLVIAAIDMPGMDCLTFLRVAKTLSDIPVVCMFSTNFLLQIIQF